MAKPSRAEYLLSLEPRERRELLYAMSDRQRRAFKHHWRLWAYEAQLPPAGAWHTWLVMAGRGFGKTRAGAEWVRAVAEADATARIALVAASLGEARRVLVESESGLLAIAPPKKRPLFEPSKHLLTWPNGASATLYSAAEPESLRGPQHSHAWCDEIAKWHKMGGHAEAAWNNLLLGLRLGASPQVVATTTPRAVPLLKRLLANGEAVVTRGRTEDNRRHLPTRFLRTIRAEFGHSLLARQELDGELIEDIEGALWSRALLEQCREDSAPGELTRVVVGVDPPRTPRPARPSSA